MTTASIGICLDTVGAVIAVIRQDPLRLAAIASVTWPEELWQPGPPPYLAMSAGQRVLTKARQRLGLPRWCPVAVVSGPSLSLMGTPDWLAPRGAELLARAAMAQGWLIAPDRAMTLRARTHLAVAAELVDAMADAQTEADLAVGAAIAVLQQETTPEPIAQPRGLTVTSIQVTPVEVTGATGWAVQRIGGPSR